MRKTHEKILRTLLAVLVLTTAMLSSGCLDDEEEISDSAANDNKQTSDSGKPPKPAHISAPPEMIRTKNF